MFHVLQRLPRLSRLAFFYVFPVFLLAQPTPTTSSVALTVNKTTGVITGPVSASTFSTANSLGGNSLPSLSGNSGKFLTNNGTATNWATIAGGGDLLSSNNLIDLASASTARANLGLTIGTHVAPATSGTSILYGNGSGGFSAVTIGGNLQFSGGMLNLSTTPNIGAATGTSLALTAFSNGPVVTTTAGARSAYHEFFRSGYTARASVGMLGSPEANLAFNMDYATGVHKYYNSSAAAVWLALSGDAALQYAPAGVSNPNPSDDIWDLSGNRYLWHITAGSTAAGYHMVLNTDMASIVAGSYDGTLTVPRAGGKPSISGVADLVIDGGKNASTAGHVYLNSYGAGNIYLGLGGGRTFFHAGTESAPAISSTTATADTGIWFPGADEVAISTGGIKRLGVGSDGAITIQRTIVNGEGSVAPLIVRTDAATASDGIGILFNALDSSVAAQTYGRILASITDPTAGSEDSTITLAAMTGGTLTTVATLTGATAVFPGTVSGTNLSGTNTGDQTITLSGDVSGSGTGGITATLATVNSNVGSFGNATTVPAVTVNGKGLVTAVSNATISIPATAISDSTAAGRTLLTAANAAAQKTALLLTASDVGLGSVENTALSTWGGSTNIVTLGNVTTGTWSGNIVSVAKGGTGVATLTANAVITGNGTGAVTSISPGTSGNVLTSNGTAWTSSAPAGGGNVTGGTLTANAVIVGTSGTGIAALASLGNSGAPLLSAGAAAPPAFGALNLAGGSNIITGTLPVGNGGTGQSSYTNGQLLIGNTTSGGLDKATLTAGSGISVTNAAGAITVATKNPTGIEVTSNTTLSATHLGQRVDANHATTNITLSVNTGTFAADDIIYVRQKGAAKAIIGGNATIVKPTSRTAETNEQNSTIVIWMIDSSTALLAGDLK